MIFDVLVPALLMLSPVVILALPTPDSCQRQVLGPEGPLGVVAARWRGRRMVRRINRARRARAYAHRGRHRTAVAQ